MDLKLNLVVHPLISKTNHYVNHYSNFATARSCDKQS